MSHELRTPLNAIINIPDGLLRFFREQEVAACGRCSSRFELEPGDEVTASTRCPDCGEAGSLELVRHLAARGSHRVRVHGGDEAGSHYRGLDAGGHPRIRSARLVRSEQP